MSAGQSSSIQSLTCLVALIAAAAAMSIGCSSAVRSDAARPPATISAHARGGLVRGLVEPVPATVEFYSNGCSGFREARFFSCCYVHDLTFWAGGKRTDRRRADLALRQCLIEISGDKVVANGGYFLMTLWMVAGEVVDGGWARAWRRTGHGRYDPLSPGQQLTVAAERQRICGGLRLNPKTGRYRVDDAPDPWREVWPAQAKQICAK